MQHYVLFKLKPSYSIDEMKALFCKTYEKLPEAIPEVTSVSFDRNTVSRKGNMDAMITVGCSAEEGLYKYLVHPLHQEFIKGTNEHIELRVAFDSAE